MGKNKREWQEVDYILKFYDSKYLTARRRYRGYVEKGLGDGRRPELVGGGLVRSAGGWSVAQSVKARSFLCYWGTRELGMTTVDLARRQNLAQPTVSQAVIRG